MNDIELCHGLTVRLTLARADYPLGRGVTVELELHGITLDGERPHRITLDEGEMRLLAAALVIHANDIAEDVRRDV